MNSKRDWREHAIADLLAERAQAPHTPLLELSLPAMPGKRLVFKDESAHPSGSLKHRLARALLLQGLSSGLIGPSTPLFDASSGNTAVSEAWFAQRIGLPYFAVIPATTSAGKIALIERFGGTCVKIPAGQCCKQAAAELAVKHGGYFLDQFLNAARAVDWRDNNVISELFSQLDVAPDWFVMGAGTGGTATCAGRYFRNRSESTRLMVVDPEDSAFFDFYACGRHPSGCLCASRIEGIGRPSVEPSFSPALVDRMMKVSDAASFAAARWLGRMLGKPVGLSTGTNLIGAIELINENRSVPSFSVASLVCDDGLRYAGKLDDPEWLAAQGLDTDAWESALDQWQQRGLWLPPRSAFQSLVSKVS